MNVKILIAALFFIAVNAGAQNLFEEKFNDCHKSKFRFCLDCGEPKASPDVDIEAYFKATFKNLPTKTNGKAMVQVIVDSLGNQCVKSMQVDASLKIAKLNIKDKVEAMKQWKPALEKDKPVSSSRVIIFTFHKGDVTVTFMDFNPKGTTNMKSVGKVEIENPGQFKNNLDEKLFHVFNTQNSQTPWDMSRSISIDKNKIVWYGTDDGLVKISANKMEVLNHKNTGLKATAYDANRTSGVMASDIDIDNNKWFSDGYTVYRYDEKTWQAFDSINSPIKWTTRIYADLYGNVYFNGFDGMAKFDGTNWTEMTVQNSKLPSNRVMGMFVDSKKRLWIGTDKGNIRIDGEKIEYFKDSENPLKTATLCKGYEDSQGNIWFSLYEKYPQTKGFAKFSPDGKWTVISTKNSNIPNNDVLDFAIDEKRNIIWLSLNKVGLSRFDGKDWMTLTPENSKVPSTIVQSINLDEFGNLWCATFAGLLKIDYPK
jgi:ligand-binding sensor domain-containing protein